MECVVPLHLFALARLVTAVASASDPAPATLLLAAPVALCDSARIDGRLVARTANGAFAPAATDPGFHRLVCGRTIDLYLVANDTLRVTLAADSAMFAGRAASRNRFLQRPHTAAPAYFATLWRETPAAFRRQWDAARDTDLAALRAAAAGDTLFASREGARIRMRHAWGRTTYPYFHWRESDAPTVAPDPGLAALLAAIPFTERRWWDLPEHDELISAIVHERARAALRNDPALRRGDARWLRAEFAAATAQFRDPALRLRVTTRLLETHLDDDGSRGIDSVLGPWTRLGPDSTTRARVAQAIADDRSHDNGHRTVVYRTIDGVPLALHLLPPDDTTRKGPRPVMLWFHGGSGTSGTWWHSPGIVTALRRNGVAVVAVEYRTGNRFDADPVEQFDDAAAAFTWVVEHATAYDFDPKRIGVAGFSSGTTLALLLATRGAGRPVGAPLPIAERRRPTAMVLTGACPAPAAPHEDGYFRKAVARHGAVTDYSPIDLIGPGQPPTVIVQAREDEYCAYGDAQAFVDRSLAAGNAAQLVTVEGAGHFFGFYYPPGQRQLRDAVADALRRWGWAP